MQIPTNPLLRRDNVHFIIKDVPRPGLLGENGSACLLAAHDIDAMIEFVAFLRHGRLSAKLADVSRRFVKDEVHE